MTLATKILTAAMASKHHVFVNWAPHVEQLHVYACPYDTQYIGNSDRVYLMNDHAYADDSAGLARILDRIEGLG